METQQKIKQIRNVAVALVRDEEGNVLLTKPSDFIKSASNDSWVFPASDIIPGATYTETFVSEILEKTGCVVEAVSLVASERYHTQGLQFEYVECKIVCRDRGAKIKATSTTFKWVHPHKIKTFYKKKIHRDILDFFGFKSKIRH